MKRLLLVALAALTAAGCAAIGNGDRDPYASPFYARYLNTGSVLDSQIRTALAAVRQNPDAPDLHNDLGVLLVQKGFPKDAEREFERAVNLDRRYYPGWYNLGLVRAARGDELGARRALRRTVDLKPGHSAALFQLGLIEEKRNHTERAIDLYAKAYGINPALLDVEVNPRILDTELTHLALLKLYPAKHTSQSMQLQTLPIARETLMPQPQQAPSPQEAPQQIVPPAPPATNPAMQPPSPERPPAEG